MSVAYRAIVPAAGIGSRMRADQPKQYLPLFDRTVLEQTLDRLLALPFIECIVVVISESDRNWETLAVRSNSRIVTVKGGAERSHSVLKALDYLAPLSEKEDWVLVHDAARPCVRTADVLQLKTILAEDPIGGILAAPVRDTMKRATEGRIQTTVERAHLWHALTPQMFRFNLLYQALKAAISKQLPVTDESSALELAGYHPRIIEGQQDNIKITHPGDLQLAELYLQQQTQQETG
ncbi:MAG TPA: 2-C-methyl-D-erythritol 4-phosphate cytidylyltransferase [Gammaproteobacteria bacterium]|nr:2-C-methyl-D-erythritol 4-phosphate cytidylyltransferase [Gammaproteobacteria bacterium]